MRFTSLPLAALLVVATAQPAQACSPSRGYRVPTNLELAERADSIVIGTVEAFEDNGSDTPPLAMVRPTVLLKGASLPGPIRLVGYSRETITARAAKDPGARPSEFPAPTRSDPRELRQPNPDALMGGCTRYLFEKGMKLVLFLQRDDKGELRFMSYPFARVSEDVPSDDAPWVKAVRLYVAIAALPKSARRAAMIARRDALRGSGDAESALLAADIDVELKSGRD